MTDNDGRFKNRVSSNSNRHKLIIESQNESEIVAFITRADTNVTEVGTKIDAEILNDWDKKVEKAFALTQNIDNSQASLVGTPFVEVTTNGNLKFNALKGERGEIGPIGPRGYTGQQGPQGNKGDKGEKGEIGLAAEFNRITAETTTLEMGSDPSVEVTCSGSANLKDVNFNFRLPRGIAGDSVHIRYSFDKLELTEQPMPNTKYIGIFQGAECSSNPMDFSWTPLWCADSITIEEYENMLSNGTINESQIYLIEGASDDKVSVNVTKQMIAEVLDLTTSQLDELVKLAKVSTIAGSENKELSLAVNSINIM